MINLGFALFYGIFIFVAYNYWSSKGFPEPIAVVAVTIALTGFIWQIYTYVIQKQYEKSAFRLIGSGCI